MNLEVPSRLLEAYAVANTPAFLYRALKGDPYVEGLRSTFTLAELRQNLLERKVADSELQAVVAAYCQLVAGLESTTDIGQQLNLIEAARLPWGERFLALHRAASSVSNSAVKRFSRATASANTVTFELSP